MKYLEFTSQSVELLTDIGEVALDSFLEESVLKDIPILGSAVKIASLSRTITDQLFLLKIKKFLLGLKNITQEEKEKFFRSLDSNQELKSKTSECLLLVINRLDDLEKAQILAELFLKFMKEKIDLETFRRLASALDIAFIEDLKKLIYYSNDNEYLSQLIRSGLAETSSTGVPTMSGFGENVIYIGVRISKLGQLFVSLMNDKD